MKATTASGLCARIKMPSLSYMRTDAQARPIDATGFAVNGISVLGIPSEGSTYFNHYLPSPRSRARVYEQIDMAITNMLYRAALPLRKAV
jgi:hypothetical protein